MPLSYVYRGTCRFCAQPLERVLAYRWDGGHDAFSVDCDEPECDKRESIVDLVGVRRGDEPLVPIHLFDELGHDASDDDFELLVADLLPDDDDGGEEPGEMYRRAFAKAEANVAGRRAAS